MTQTLRAAGVPAQAIGEVKDVVNACVVCRDWHRPGTHNVATFKISLAFNEEVEFDLMFYQSLVEPRRGRLVIVHLVDCCIRWDVATVIANKEEDTILAAITMFWIAIFGPMGTLTLDEETGMRGRRAADWADAHNIQLRFKAPSRKPTRLSVTTSSYGLDFMALKLSRSRKASMFHSSKPWPLLIS